MTTCADIISHACIFTPLYVWFASRLLSSEGSDLVEVSSSQINISDLRSDLLPVVWKLSSLQGVSTTRMAGEITFKELAQVSLCHPVFRSVIECYCEVHDCRILEGLNVSVISSRGYRSILCPRLWRSICTRLARVFFFFFLLCPNTVLSVAFGT